MPFSRPVAPEISFRTPPRGAGQTTKKFKKLVNKRLEKGSASAWLEQAAARKTIRLVNGVGALLTHFVNQPENTPEA